jgi:hypothetical protein
VAIGEADLKQTCVFLLCAAVVHVVLVVDNENNCFFVVLLFLLHAIAVVYVGLD